MKEGQCPFLEMITVSYCKAFSMRKMIPVDKTTASRGLCNSSGFRKCLVYRDRSNRADESESIHGFQQKPDLYFHPRHMWISLPEESRNRARAGIDDLAQKLIGRIDRISAPAEGSSLRENTVCLLLHAGERTVRMVAPLDGLVESVNPKVVSDPSLINREPYEEGWIFTMSTTGEGLRRLFHGCTARSWFEWEVEKAQRLLGTELSGGATATDGGEWLRDAGGRIGDAQWAGINAIFFG